MSQIVTTTNTDLKIVKTELFDPDVMDALLRDKSFGKRDLNNLGRYKRGRKNGNRTEVVYHYGTGCADAQLGRLYPHGGQGLQSFPFDIRNPLLEKHYWDVDIENCHYTILAKLADDWGLKTENIRYYIANRDECLAAVSSNRGISKVAFLKVAYGGDIKLCFGDNYNDDGIQPDGDVSLLKRIEAEMSVIVETCWWKYERFHKIVKKKPNQRFSLFALILQTEERKCLLAIDEYLKGKGRSMDVLIHDGGCVRKIDGESAFPMELLKGCEEAVLTQTGYAVKVVNKPIKHSFKMEEVTNILPESVTIDDTYAARKFAEIMGEELVFDGKKLYVFDNRNGTWSDDESLLNTRITECGDGLIFHQQSSNGIKTFNYSGMVKNCENLKKKLPSVSPTNLDFIKNGRDRAMNKLLFKNGILDFETDVFIAGFDRSIVFDGAIPYDYVSEVKRDAMEFVMNTLFREPFNNTTTPDILLHYLMRATIGDYRCKKTVVALGDTNSSKGTLTNFMEYTLGTNATTFNPNSLLMRRNGGEAEREMSWLLPISNTRIAFSNEMRISEGTTIDGNMVKSIVSGGDTLVGRKLYREGERFTNRCMPVLFAQDLPPFTPPEAVKSRLVVVQYNYSFMASPNPNNPNEKQGDPDIKDKLMTEQNANAMIHILLNQFRKWKADNKKDIVLPDYMIRDAQELAPDNDFRALLEEQFVVTCNPEDYVEFKAVKKFVADRGLILSDTKIGRELGKLNLVRGAKKLDRTTKTVVYGMIYAN